MRKRVVVTGASSGVGRAAALLLGAERVELVLTARRGSLLAELQEEVHDLGGLAHTFEADLNNPSSAWDLIQFARCLPGESYPILLNSAGVAEFGDFATVFAPHIEEQLRVNLLAPMLTTHAALPWMLEQKGGQIINVLSIAAIETLPGSAVYTAAKTGLLAFGRVVAAEYRALGIKLTSLIPGAVDTPLWDNQAFCPPKSEMLPKESLAEAIRDLILLPHDRNVDEIHLLPPKGIL